MLRLWFLFGNRFWYQSPSLSCTMWWHQPFLQQHASEFFLFPLTSGIRLFTVTLPIWGSAIPHQPQPDKNKEIAGAWFPSAVFTPAQFWQVTNMLVKDSGTFSAVLVSERGGRVTSAYCFLTETRPQIVNNPMEKQQLSLRRVHALLMLYVPGFFPALKWQLRHVQEVKLNKLAGLNVQGNYRQSHCKTSTTDAHLVTRWSQQQQTHIFNWWPSRGLLSVNLFAAISTS